MPFALAIGIAFGVFFDARRIGYDHKRVTGIAALSPGGWLFCAIVLPIVSTPLYFAHRSKLVAAARGEVDASTGAARAGRFAGAFVAMMAALMAVSAYENAGPPDCDNADVVRVATEVAQRMFPSVQLSDVGELGAGAPDGARMCIASLSGSVLIPNGTLRRFMVTSVTDGRFVVQYMP